MKLQQGLLSASPSQARGSPTMSYGEMCCIQSTRQAELSATLAATKAMRLQSAHNVDSVTFRLWGSQKQHAELRRGYASASMGVNSAGTK